MSSFQCTDKHFRTIEKGLIKRQSESHCYALREYHTASMITDLVKEWHKLNQVTVSIQYKEPIDNYALTAKKGDSLTDVQLLKALQCLYYQIEMEQFDQTYKEPKNFVREATDFEKEIYKVLEEVIQYLSSKVISALPEYNDAKWSID